MKKSLFLFSSIIMIFTLTACGQLQVADNKTPRDDSSGVTNDSNVITDEDKKIIENGYQVGDYRFKLLGIQKKDEEILRDSLSDIDRTVKHNFEQVKGNINTKQKVSLLPTLTQYNREYETLTVNYFLVNNTMETIRSIRIIGMPEFQSIKSENDISTYFSEEDFAVLDHNNFVLFTLTFNIKKDYLEQLSKLKSTDLKINITELEINGTKTDNINDN